MARSLLAVRPWAGLKCRGVFLARDDSEMLERNKREVDRWCLTVNSRSSCIWHWEGVARAVCAIEPYFMSRAKPVCDVDWAAAFELVAL